MKKDVSQRILLISLCSILLISLFAVVVSAADTPAPVNLDQQTATARAWMSGFGQSLGDQLKPLFQDQSLLTKLMFGILLWMVIYTTIESIFGSGRWTTWFIAGLVTVISMIAIPGDFLGAIMLSYGAMGAAILTVIPFMIILVFTVKVRSLLVGRLIWIFFCIYYFAIAIYEWLNAGYWTDASIVYGASVIAGLVIFFLIGSIRKAIFKGQMSSVKESGNQVVSKAKLLHKLQAQELESSYAQGENQGN